MWTLNRLCGKMISFGFFFYVSTVPSFTLFTHSFLWSLLICFSSYIILSFIPVVFFSFIIPAHVYFFIYSLLSIYVFLISEFISIYITNWLWIFIASAYRWFPVCYVFFVSIFFTNTYSSISTYSYFSWLTTNRNHNCDDMCMLQILHNLFTTLIVCLFMHWLASLFIYSHIYRPVLLVNKRSVHDLLPFCFSFNLFCLSCITLSLMRPVVQYHKPLHVFSVYISITLFLWGSVKISSYTNTNFWVLFAFL